MLLSPPPPASGQLPLSLFSHPQRDSTPQSSHRVQIIHTSLQISINYMGKITNTLSRVLHILKRVYRGINITLYVGSWIVFGSISVIVLLILLIMRNRKKRRGGKNTRSTKQTFLLFDLYSKIFQLGKQAKFIRPSVRQVTIHEGDNYTLDIALFSYDNKVNTFQKQSKVCELENSTQLYYNKYPVFKLDIILHNPQINTLFPATCFQQIIKTVRALKGIYLHNKGPDSGAVKQQQSCVLCLNSEAKNLRMIEKISLFAQKIINQDSNDWNDLIQFPGFQFEHSMAVFDQTASLENLAVQVYCRYNEMKRKLTKQLSKIQSYNLVGSENFLLMIPRRNSHTFEQIRINASAFFGLIVTETRDSYEKIKRHSASSILREVTFPKQI